MRKYVAPQSQPQPQMEGEVTQQAARHKRQRGFTLIEMLAVVTILAIVAGIGFVVVNSQIEKARINTDIANLRTIGDAMNRYIMDNGNPLNGSFSMNNLLGKYLGSAPSSPWPNDNNPYQITVVSQPMGMNPGVIKIQSPHSYTSPPPGAQSGDPNTTPGLIINGNSLYLSINY